MQTETKYLQSLKQKPATSMSIRAGFRLVLKYSSTV